MKIHPTYRRTLRAILLSLLFIASEGCARRAEKAVNPGESEITVAAASNLSAAFDEVGRRFTARTGVRVTFSFGATGDLARQIENGAPFDVFAAADVAHVARLERAGSVESGSLALYARGRVVLWIPPGSDLRIERLEDLAHERVTKIALAKPDVAPYGQAAVEALQAKNLWSKIEPKAVYAQNVSQARQFAATRNADAAFIPRALVREGEGRFIEIDERLHRPIEQALGIVRASEKQDAARRFVDYVLSDEGQALLESFSYGRIDRP